MFGFTENQYKAICSDYNFESILDNLDDAVFLSKRNLLQGICCSCIQTPCLRHLAIFPVCHLEMSMLKNAKRHPNTATQIVTTCEECELVACLVITNGSNKLVSYTHTQHRSSTKAFIYNRLYINANYGTIK